MDLSSSHIGFVLVAYAITAAVLLGLTLWIIIDLKAQRTALARLEDGSAPHRRRKAAQAREATQAQEAET